MWYDKYPGVPPRGTPLETVFLLVKIQRHQTELLATRSLVMSEWAQLAKNKEAAEKSFEAYQSYCDTMFPFLERLQEGAGTDSHKLLLEHVKRPMRINLGALRQELAGEAKTRALLKYGQKFRLPK